MKFMVTHTLPSGVSTTRRMKLSPALPTFNSLLAAFHELFPEAPQDEHYIIQEEDLDFGVGCFIEVADYSLLADKSKLLFIRNGK